MGDRNKTRGNSKQSHKPYARFPLTAHKTGRWCKKIPKSAPRDAGKLYYFGPVSDWAAALDRYDQEWKYVIKGKDIPAEKSPDGEQDVFTIRVLCNEFLNSKRAKLNSGDLAHRTFADYHRTCERLVNHFGKDRRIDDLQPSDFRRFRAAMAKVFGVVTLKNEINRCRITFGSTSRFDPKEQFKDEFNKPAARLIRRARNEAGPRVFKADELRMILDALAGKPVKVAGKDEPQTLKAEPLLYAMTLLGVNCGFGNTDVANLPRSAVDLDRGWVDFPRPKTEIPRHIPLWPETVDALRAAIAKRPKPIDRADANCVFLTRQGRRWVRVQESVKSAGTTLSLDALAQRFGRLLKKIDVNGNRNFYALRHNLQTIGGNAKDPDAVSAIMGHVDPSMAAVYREGISDERLRAVTDTIHRWLWPRDDANESE